MAGKIREDSTVPNKSKWWEKVSSYEASFSRDASLEIISLTELKLGHCYLSVGDTTCFLSGVITELVFKAK